jgi:hypothetical protein
MDYKKISKDLDRTNYFKNIALKVNESCIQSFDSEDLSEEEDKCIRDNAVNLHKIVERAKMDQFLMLTGFPKKLY